MKKKNKHCLYVSKISYNIDTLNQKIPKYQSALEKSEYRENLTYANKNTKTPEIGQKDY